MYPRFGLKPEMWNDNLHNFVLYYYINISVQYDIWINCFHDSKIETPNKFNAYMVVPKYFFGRGLRKNCCLICARSAKFLLLDPKIHPIFKQNFILAQISVGPPWRRHWNNIPILIKIDSYNRITLYFISTKTRSCNYPACET